MVGPMRWLTVRVPGDAKEILLEKPGPPAHDSATEAQVRELAAKGAGGGWLAFTAFRRGPGMIVHLPGMRREHLRPGVR